MSGIGFILDSNVNITQLDAMNIIKKELTIHNKATRQFVVGILRFIMGHFTSTYANDNTETIVDFNNAKKYIPCYINFGDGGVIKTNNKPVIEYQTGKLTTDWTTNYYNKYNDTKLTSEMNIGVRYSIGADSFEFSDNTVVGDMDQIVFNIAIAPGTLNIYDDTVTKTTPAVITELGLFASPTIGTEDLLAKVIINNPKDILVVKPQDTLLITWTISILALGDDSVLTLEDETYVEDSKLNNVDGYILKDET